MIHIRYAKISAEHHQKFIEKFLIDYPAEFQHKIKRYRRWQDAQLSLLGRVLLFEGLKFYNKKYTHDDIILSEYNKPYFKDKGISFNISHSGEIVVCALTDECEIGIDIEFLRAIQIADFRTQMTDGEWEKIISSGNTIKAFYDYWTSKEAVIKAHGNGLSIPLKSFEIQQNRTVIDATTFYLKEIRISDFYKCYICSGTVLDDIPVEIIPVNIS